MGSGGAPPATRLDGVAAFRYSSYETPFWARANTLPGRWHRAEDGPTQYLSLAPEGAWAELARREDLRSDEELSLVHMPIWAAVVTQQQVADYRDFGDAEGAGFAAQALVDDDYARCQDEGRRLRSLGFAGVLAPSAALPGAVNLTLFGPRLWSTWGVPTRLASDIPACVVAVGAPAPGLAARVRYRGAAHAGWRAYASGRRQGRSP